MPRSMKITVEQALQTAVVAHKGGNLSEAERMYRAILQIQPNHADANHNLGVIAVSLNQIEVALPLFKTALDTNPNVEQFWLSYVHALGKAARLKDAKQAIKRAKKKGFDAKKLEKLLSQTRISTESDAEAHFNLGNALQRIGRFSEAEASYNQAIAIRAKYAEAHNNLGVTLQQTGRLGEAEASYNKAIALRPDYVEAHNNLGVTLQQMGRLSEAEASYNQAIALKPDFAEAYRQWTQLKKLDGQDERVLKMLELYRDASMSDEQRCHINFGLAKVCEDLDDFERAFTHYADGNELRKKFLGYDVSQDVELFRKIKVNYPLLEQVSFEPEELSIEPTPIFIVGMPRSGTTLVEQIVSSHPLVTGGGELPYADLLGSAMATDFSDSNPEGLLNFRNNYLDKLEGHSGGRLWITDKAPRNFRYLGLLAKAFPEAKFIHVKRRPEAVCWGNFKTFFNSHHLGYAWSIGDIVAYYKLYQSLMEFWDSKLGHKVYNLDYELLTDNQEPETRKLISFIGLPWEKSCLHPEDNTKTVLTASNLQVRQKVYRGSSEQWKKYEPFLNGAFTSLSV